MSKSIRILAVDDQAQNILFLKKHLNFENCEIDGALSGEECIKLVQDNDYDLILLDILMPGMSGYEVCKIIKEDEKKKDVPVIFLTAKSEVESRIEGLDTGAVDYIIKPFHLEELRARVRAALRIKKVYDELKEKAVFLEEKAMTDELTSLYNRRYIKQRLIEELARAKRFKTSISCLILDVDQFKSINDTYGHLQGDLILKEFAAVVKSLMRSIDIVGRYGGEEFVVILLQTDIEGAKILAEKIRKSVENYNFPGPTEAIKLTTSIGIASFIEEEIEDADALFYMADHALYKAKEMGRNRVISWKNH